MIVILRVFRVYVGATHCDMGAGGHVGFEGRDDVVRL